MEKQKYPSKFDRILDSVNSLLSWIAGSMIVVAMIIIFVDVIMRYIFNKPLIWVYYFSEYLLLYSTFLAAAYVLQVDRHISVDILFASISKQKGKYVRLTADILGLIYTLFLFWYSSEETYTAFTRSSRFSTPLENLEYPIMIIIPIGCLFLILQWGRRIRDRFRSL